MTGDHVTLIEPNGVQRTKSLTSRGMSIGRGEDNDLVVGYAAASPGPKIIRDTGEMVHYDDCGIRDFRTDEEVKAYAEITRAWCLAEH